MHKRKNIYKLGLSLLIALAFILPGASVLGAGRDEASATTRPVQPMPDVIKMSDGPVAQQCAVTPLGVFDPDFGPIVGPIPAGTYDLWAELQVEPGCLPNALVKVFLEIYEKSVGTEVVLYETSFEDNFDIYNNWVQIDADCGLGGYYDSWAWSDARASDGDHSMKNTMYDIYKGNQDDYLESTQCFDISDQYAVNVSYDIWVDGSGDWLWSTYYTAFDFLNFEVYNDQLGEWINPDNYYGDMPAMPDDDMIFIDGWGMFLLPGAYKFFDTTGDIFHPYPTLSYLPKVRDLGNGWWHVWYTITTADYIAYGGNPECFKFRFSWQSDPEVQFEGAYVDNVKVVSIEDVETKIWQGHTQGPIELIPDPVDQELFYINFPLDWEATNTGDGKCTIYDMKLWIEVLDAGHFTTNDWPNWVPIVVQVGNYYDAEVVDVLVEQSNGNIPVLPGTGVVNEGTDLHIVADVHLEGTVPATNVPVTLTAIKKVKTVGYFTDFEAGAMGWEFGTFNDLDSLWHVTDVDAWSGAKSLGCFDETSNHYVNNMYYDYALNNGYTVDIRDWVHCYLDYTTKFLTEWSGDSWRILLYDQATNYILSHSASAIGFNPYGYQPSWIGPDQPQSKYKSFDLMYWYDYWYTIRGFMRNNDGSQSFEFGTGFTFYASDSYGYVNAQADSEGIYWSGLYLDDVTISGQMLGDEVYSQVIIIPEMQPCEMYTVQFEWENVPYCNYQLVIDVNPEGACNNFGFEPWTGQILVVDTLETIHPKAVETIDYTAGAGGEWVISSSDTDNYIATNAGLYAATPADQIIELCPNNGGDCDCDPGSACCIDVSQQMADTLPIVLTFNAWWEVYGYPSGYGTLDLFVGCPCDTMGWTTLWYFDYASYLYAEADEDGWVTFDGALGNGPSFDIGAELGSATSFCLRFRYIDADTGVSARGIKLDDIKITNMIVSGFPPVVSDFIDSGDDGLVNWCQTTTHVGDYWFHVYDRTGVAADFGVFCNFYDINNNGINDPADYVPNNLNDALIWTTEITEAYEAYLAFQTDYQLESNYDFGYVEISIAGTDDWKILYKFTGNSVGWKTYQMDISDYAGEQIQLRFRLVSDNIVNSDHWCIKLVTITGKSDALAPSTTATMSGTQKESGWYTTPVKIVITATDMGGAGMGEIHYKLDGVEKVVAGSKAEVTVSGNGEHTFEYWGVDAVGNVETPHNILQAFKIDSGAKPTVSITAPTPGIYLMGKKIMASAQTIIIGGFTVEATAADTDSGIYRVSFYLDGNVVADDTTAPYSAYICQKHTGAGTIKAVAEDYAQNTAEASMDLKYFKFF